MHHRQQVWTWFVIALSATAGPSAWAQEEADPPAVVQPNDPAVEAILATNPATPAEWTRAARILSDLGRPDLARGMLKRVLDAQLDDARLIALYETHGAAVFTALAARGDLAPEARQLTDAVLSAVERQVHDPARLAGLVEQLQDPSAEVRFQAVVELRKARASAVAPLLAVLSDPARADQHDRARAALVAIGPDVVDPLIAALEAPDPRVQVEAIRALGDLKSDRATLFLLRPHGSSDSDPQVRQAAEAALVKLVRQVPSRADAAGLLVQKAQAYFDRLEPMREDAEGRVTWWSWDSSGKQPVREQVPATIATLRVASRLARDAFSLAPDDVAARRLYLATSLELAAYEQGLDRPRAVGEGTAAGNAAAMGPEVIDDLLAWLLPTDHFPAAEAAARILGQRATADVLRGENSSPAPLVRATWHANRRVRFAALKAIVALDPAQAFPGSSRVAEGILFFAGSSIEPRALVACPLRAEAQRVGGFLVPLGYQVDTAVSGREALAQLLASPDYELAFFDAALERPTVDLLIQQLRHDCRTAGLPVGVTARSGQLSRAQRVARDAPLTEAFSRPHSAESVAWQVERLLALVGPHRTTPAERQNQAARALKWLADLSGRERSIYDLRRAEEAAMTALYVPGSGPDALAILERAGTPTSQRALVDFAGRWPQTIELRQMAAAAFRKSVEKHGILLTTDEITAQYDRYNESEMLDSATQQVLGSILDSLEAPARIRHEATGEGRSVPPGDDQAATGQPEASRSSST